MAIVKKSLINMEEGGHSQLSPTRNICLWTFWPLSIQAKVLLNCAEQWLGCNTDDPEATPHPAIASESRIHLFGIPVLLLQLLKLTILMYEYFINQKSHSPTKVYGA